MCDSWHPHKSNLDVGLNGLTHDNVKDETKCVYTRRIKDFDYGQPISEPIVHSSTYRVKSVQQYTDIIDKGGYVYARFNSPTCETVEATVNLLEQGAGSLVFSSGTAAIATCMLTFLGAGDNIMICHPVQNCTLEIVQKVLVPLGVDVTLVEGGSCDDFKSKLKPNTKVIFAETPGNPLVTILDLEGLGEISTSLRDRGVITMVDGTFASPLLQKPLKYGIDLSIHSATKFLSGHGDLCAGVVTARTVELWNKLLQARRTYGTILSPFDASLLLRGIRSLHVRVPRQASTAQRLAEHLENHPAVERVYYPFLSSHPGHVWARKQMSMGGGMFAALFKGGKETVVKFFENLRLFNRGVSLGNIESLADHPSTMSHGGDFRTEDERSAYRIQDGHVRFACGLEDPEDLIADITQALEKANETWNTQGEPHRG